MSATVRIDGIEEQRRAWLALPRTLAGNSQPVVTDAAQVAAAEIRAAYPRRTGALASGVTVAPSRLAGTEVAAARVVNYAMHAAIFEHGTQARHTSIGANRGAMAAGNVFVPRVIRARQALEPQVASVMTREGLTVVRRG
jgi:hypothetical protein